MLKLVTSNNEATDHIKTCSTSCVLFNSKHQSCPIFKGVNYNDSNVVERCMEYIDIKGTEEQYDNGSTYQLENSEPPELPILETRAKNGTQSFNYPFEPEIDFSQTISDIFWYIDPEEKYGCWIKKHPKQRLAVTHSSKEFAEKGWEDSIYRSPVPLHDHAASPSLKTRMCWFVDEKGWGQYTLIEANQIKFITSKAPML